MDAPSHIAFCSMSRSTGSGPFVENEVSRCRNLHAPRIETLPTQRPMIAGGSERLAVVSDLGRQWGSRQDGASQNNR
jgi:hypothetical protein